MERLAAEDRRTADIRRPSAQQLRSMREQLEARDGELAALKAQHDTLRSLAAVRAERIRELEAELTRKDAALAKLASDLAELETKAPVEEDGDDLKQLRGVGPTFERRLKAIGVCRLEQIASWSTEDILRVAEQLKIHAKRIVNDGWVEVAQTLLAESTD